MNRRVLGLSAIVGVTMAASVVTVRVARSADHLDAPATKADPTADLNDLYTWVDGNNFILALTLFPAATTSSKFSDALQYVFHTTSGATFGAISSTEDLICTFDASQKIQCWLGTDEYVTGDASSTAGLSSADGKLKVFAGLRADPFFFNLDGFHHAEATVESATGLTADEAGCPQLDPATAATLREQLQSSPDGGPAGDFFRTLNGLAIVVSIDKTLVTKGGPVVSTWASSNKAP
jgi:hypothetical protein